MLASSIALMFIISLCSCLNEEGDLSYRIKVSASDHTESLDYSNIPNLNEQPLRVIRKAGEGEWKIISWRNTAYQNSFVTFTQDSVIFRYCESVPAQQRYGDYRCSWEIRAVDWSDEPPFDYIYRYSMKNPNFPYDREDLYLTRIQNDTLYGLLGPFITSSTYKRHIKLLRIKE